MLTIVAILCLWGFLSVLVGAVLWYRWRQAASRALADVDSWVEEKRRLASSMEADLVEHVLGDCPLRVGVDDFLDRRAGLLPRCEKRGLWADDDLTRWAREEKRVRRQEVARGSLLAIGISLLLLAGLHLAAIFTYYGAVASKPRQRQTAATVPAAPAPPANQSSP